MLKRIKIKEVLTAVMMVVFMVSGSLTDVLVSLAVTPMPTRAPAKRNGTERDVKGRGEAGAPGNGTTGQATTGL